MTPVLEVRNLSVTFATDDGAVTAVDGVGFAVEAGRTLAIVGESGSGKTVSCLSILGLVQGATVTGSARLLGRELVGLAEPALRAVRGRDVGVIFQDPLSSLHPHHRVGWQVIEAVRAHERLSRAAARRRAVELLGTVGIPQPARRVDDYPHEFSGGMRQRVLIAMALALQPAVLIADEPTTALDVTVQAQILLLLDRIQDELGTAIVLITHDLGVVADCADEVLVLYAGQPVEAADVRAAFYHPHHPYTLALLETVSLNPARDSKHVQAIRGAPVSAIHRPAGCPFHPRCPFVMPVCRSARPELAPAGAAHVSACHLDAAEQEALRERSAVMR